LHQRLRRQGFELARYPAVTDCLRRRARLLRHHQVDLVIDVGANCGQYGAMLRRLGYGGRMVSFEPLHDAFQRLQRAAATDPLWETRPLACGAVVGPATLHVAGNSESSSLLAMLPAHVAAEPRSACVGEQSVTVTTLDAVFPGLHRGERQVWLKIDTQGSEAQVLHGAAQTLNQVQWLQIELSLRPLYAGALEFDRMQALVRGLGFDWFGLEPGFSDPATGELLQVDGIFKRRAAP